MRAGKASRTPARGMAVPQPNKGAASFSSPKRAISRSPLRSLGSVSRLCGGRLSALVAEKADRFGSQSDPGIGDAADGSAPYGHAHADNRRSAPERAARPAQSAVDNVAQCAPSNQKPWPRRSDPPNLGRPGSPSREPQTSDPRRHTAPAVSPTGAP